MGAQERRLNNARTLGTRAGRGLRVPGEPFQVSTIEAHDAMVKFGSMPQTLDVEWQLVGIGSVVGLIGGYILFFHGFWKV